MKDDKLFACFNLNFRFLQCIVFSRVFQHPILFSLRFLSSVVMKNNGKLNLDHVAL